MRRFLNVGSRGVEALGELVRRGANEHVCILIDQLEELFAYAKRSDSNEATLLVEFMLGVFRYRPSGIYVIATMRSEFLGAFSKFPGSPKG